MKCLFWSVFMSFLCLRVQAGGIDFLQNSTWEDILQKAKIEHKSIFVDCYASWCGPCKLMDKEVYPSDAVGAFMNQNYLSVKVQMDSTKQDSKDVQNWYSIAHTLGIDYSITVYPSFLFFSPDGVILNKEIGAKDVNEFMIAVKASLNRNTQYFTLLHSFENGELSYSDMPNLAAAADRLGQNSLVNKVSQQYLTHIATLAITERWTKANLQFIKWHKDAISPVDSIFKLYFQDRKWIDSVAGFRGYTTGTINSIIYLSEISPQVNDAIAKKDEPNWKKMNRAIIGKYGEDFAATNILNAKIDFYKGAKKYNTYAKYFVIRSGRDSILYAPAGLIADFRLNNRAFEVFQYSTNKKDLRTALSWINKAISMEGETKDAEDLDTKANILYKLGRKKEALPVEEQAVALSPKNKEILENFLKMKAGQPTWSYN